MIGTHTFELAAKLLQLFIAKVRLCGFSTHFDGIDAWQIDCVAVHHFGEIFAGDGGLNGCLMEYLCLLHVGLLGDFGIIYKWLD